MKDKPISVHEASKTTRRCAPVRTTDAAQQYTVFDPKSGEKFTGKLDMVMGMCPKVKPTTLRARLRLGERNLDKLRRKPTPPQARRMR